MSEAEMMDERGSSAREHPQPGRAGSTRRDDELDNVGAEASESANERESRPSAIDDISPVNKPGGRWWAAVAVGGVAAIPLGWLLSYGAMLPALLGLFFFMLFGLVIGACIFRVASPIRPLPLRTLRVGIWLIVAFCWCLSMYVEVREFPGDKATDAIRRVQMMPDGMDRASLMADVERTVRETLRRDYGGDGFFGYARWVLSSGRMEYKVATMDNPIVLTSVQNKGWWLARVVLSIAMLWFGVRAQVLLLSRATDAKPKVDDVPASAT